MHSRNLNINTTQIVLKKLSQDDKSTENVLLGNTNFDKSHEMIIISTVDKLTKGSKYELYIPFDAELGTGLLGYYRSSYLDKSTNKRV